MGTPQDPQARAKQKARRRRKEARLREKKAATQATPTEEKKLQERRHGPTAHPLGRSVRRTFPATGRAFGQPGGNPAWERGGWETKRESPRTRARCSEGG